MPNNRKHVHRALDRVNKNSESRTVDIDTGKFIIFSDHHRGRRDGADDFLNNEVTYLKALDYYLQQGFTLILLGDVEEFWENPFKIVIKSYREVLEKESAFYQENRLIRIWGNHDEVWRAKSFLKKHLGDIFTGIEAYECIRLNFHDQQKAIGTMLLVHGHQGTAASERFAEISRFFVRYGWRYIQKWFNIPLSTPSTNIQLKSELDLDMFSWASAKSRLVLICGHTHQPVFMSFTHADFLTSKIVKLQHEINASLKNPMKDIALLEKEKSAAVTELRRIQKDYGGTNMKIEKGARKPCYFNTGCCSFSNGAITGIEIDHGKIRLVKWSPLQDYDRMILEESDLKRIFEACR